MDWKLTGADAAEALVTPCCEAIALAGMVLRYTPAVSEVTDRVTVQEVAGEILALLMLKVVSFAAVGFPSGPLTVKAPHFPLELTVGLLIFM